MPGCRFEYRGRHGFDVLGEHGVACRGSWALVKPLGKSQLPTMNWHWLRNFGS